MTAGTFSGRGEGWGLPIAEALAMGVPAIATNFSGPTAYASRSSFTHDLGAIYL
jgi:glycosyltransferase involved in cell wall biosynthesis